MDHIGSFPKRVLLCVTDFLFYILFTTSGETMLFTEGGRLGFDPEREVWCFIVYWVVYAVNNGVLSSFGHIRVRFLFKGGWGGCQAQVQCMD